MQFYRQLCRQLHQLKYYSYNFPYIKNPSALYAKGLIIYLLVNALIKSIGIGIIVDLLLSFDVISDNVCK